MPVDTDGPRFRDRRSRTAAPPVFGAQVNQHGTERAMKQWMYAAVVVGTMLSSAARADDPGIRVVIRVPADVAVPDPEALLTRIAPQGHEGLTVAVHKKAENGIDETRIDLWGKTLAQAEIEGALRSGFPMLAGAEIVVSAVAASEKPAVPEECKDRKAGKCKVVKHL